MPFNSGYPFGVSLLPEVHGSNLINTKLDNLGLTNKETYFVTGVGHEFHGTDNGTWENGTGGNVYWDTLVEKSTNFFWLQHKPEADFTFNPNALQVDFTDASTGAESWSWDFGDGNSSTQQNPAHTYALEGTYKVLLYIENDILSWDTISYNVEVSSPLPVSWISPLKAFYTDYKTILSWSVSHQFNNQGFIIEHSLENQPFRSIAEIKGEKEWLFDKSYSYIHENPPEGWNFYRITQADFDGKSNYSNIASIQAKKSLTPVLFYPNPATDILTVEFQDGGPCTVEIYNVLGSLVRSYSTSNGTELLDISGIETGLYYIKTRDSAEFQKLIIN